MTGVKNEGVVEHTILKYVGEENNWVVGTCQCVLKYLLEYKKLYCS